MQPGEHLGVHAGHPGGGVPQSLALDVLAEGVQQLADGCFDPRAVEGRHAPAQEAGSVPVARRRRLVRGGAGGTAGAGCGCAARWAA